MKGFFAFLLGSAEIKCFLVLATSMSCNLSVDASLDD